jgi:hypothetical protein
LREVPLVSLRIRTAVSAVAEGEVVQLLDNRRAGVLRAVVVVFDVVDEDVGVRGSADSRRIAKLARRLADIDPAAAGRDFQLGMEPAGAASRAVDLGKAERAREEVDRGLAVLLEQVWRDGLRHGAEATASALPRLGKMLRESGR